MVQERDDAVADEGRTSQMPMVRSVERAGQILEALLSSPNGLRLVDLSETLGLHKTTVFRLLRTLVGINVVRKSKADDRYHWDPLRWMLVARNLRETGSKLDLIRAMLQELVNATGQTALLSVPDGRQRTMLPAACTVPKAAVRADLTDQPPTPLHATADGKLYLSTLSPTAVAAYLKQNLVSFTPYTITAHAPLLAQLEHLGRQEYAISRQEFVLNAAAVCVPVLDERGAMAAGLSLIGPLDQFTEVSIARWLGTMRALSGQFSQLLYPMLGVPSAQKATAAGEDAVSQNETGFRKNYRVL